MSKPRLTVYLSDSVADRLALACKRPGANKSKLVDSALDKYLNSQGNSSSDASLLRRLDHMSKQITKLDRNASVILETLGLFVRYYLIITPPLPKSEQDPARSMGNQRFEFFVTQIGRRLAAGQSLVRDVMELVSTNDPDLFARDLDDPALNNSASSTTSSSGPAGPGRGGEAPVQRGQGFASRPPSVAPGASSPFTGKDNG